VHSIEGSRLSALSMKLLRSPDRLAAPAQLGLRQVPSTHP
jgi:hypothetical protein